MENGSNSSSTIVPFERTLRIAGLRKNSTIDFPGRLSAVVFFAGCNYDCYYCHNRHILNAPAPADADAILGFLEKRSGLLDGVVLSGGEATLQGGLYSFARKVKSLGYAVKLDTNGSRPETVRAMTAEGLADFVAMDYKAPLYLYDRICGGEAAGGSGVLETVQILYHSDVPFEVRVTMIPEITEKKLCEMAESLPRLAHFVLQLYRPAGSEGGPIRVAQGENAPYTRNEIEKLAAAIRYAQPGVRVRA